MRYYGNNLDSFTDAESEHQAAKDDLHSQVPELVRLYLIAVKSQLEMVTRQVAGAIDSLSTPHFDNDVTAPIAAEARAAVPSLDDILHGDHLGQFVGQELTARTLHELQPIGEVTRELMGKVYELPD